MSDVDLTSADKVRAVIAAGLKPNALEIIHMIDTGGLDLKKLSPKDFKTFGVITAVMAELCFSYVDLAKVQTADSAEQANAFVDDLIDKAMAERID